MKILVNGKPVERLKKRDRKSLARGNPADEIAGTVLSGEAATAKVVFFARFLFVSLLVLVGGMEAWVVFNLLGETAAQDRQTVILSAIAAAFVVSIACYLGYQRMTERWMQNLPDRIAALPPPGTEIRLDTQRVMIGARAADWSKLRIDRLEIIRSGGGEAGDSLVAERIVLTGAGEPMTLDSKLIENGAKMVATACRRLLRVEEGEDDAPAAAASSN